MPKRKTAKAKTATLAKKVVGRRIVAVQQDRFYNQNIGRWVYHTSSIRLDNGTSIRLMACETDTEPYVEAVAIEPNTISCAARMEDER